MEADVVMVICEPEPPAVTDCGLNDTAAPAGRPVAPRATSWGVPMAVVVMEDVAGEPAVTVWLPGESAMVKSPGGGGGEPGLNRAMPAAQVMLAPKLPEKVWEPVVATSR